MGNHNVYNGDQSAEQWIAVHTVKNEKTKNRREASSELWEAFKLLAPKAAGNCSRTRFGNAIKAKHGIKSKSAKVRTIKGKLKVSKWYNGIQLIPRSDLNKKAENHKWQYYPKQRTIPACKRPR